MLHNSFNLEIIAELQYIQLKTNKMRHFFTLLLFVFGLSACSQSLSSKLSDLNKLNTGYSFSVSDGELKIRHLFSDEGVDEGDYHLLPLHGNVTTEMEYFNYFDDVMCECQVEYFEYKIRSSYEDVKMIRPRGSAYYGYDDRGFSSSIHFNGNIESSRKAMIILNDILRGY